MTRPALPNLLSDDDLSTVQSGDQPTDVDPCSHSKLNKIFNYEHIRCKDCLKRLRCDKFHPATTDYIYKNRFLSSTIIVILCANLSKVYRKKLAGESGTMYNIIIFNVVNVKSTVDAKSITCSLKKCVFSQQDISGLRHDRVLWFFFFDRPLPRKSYRGEET